MWHSCCRCHVQGSLSLTCFTLLLGFHANALSSSKFAIESVMNPVSRDATQYKRKVKGL